MLHQVKSTSFSISQFFQVLVLAGVLSFFPGHEAKAQWITFDPTTLAQDVIQWAKDAAQWVVQNYNAVQNNMLTAGNGNITNNASMISTKALIDAHATDTNTTTEGMMTAANGGIQAKLSGDTTTSPNSTYGATMMLQQALADAKSIAEAAGAFAASAARQGTGAYADLGSTAAQVRGICSRAGQGWSFYDPVSYQGTVDQITCSTAGGSKITLDSNSPYINLDQSENTVIKYPQYPLPQATSFSRDNFVTFTGVTANPGKTYADPVYFVASYNYCAGLISLSKTPPSTANPTGMRPEVLAEIAAKNTDQDSRKGNSSATACFEQLLLHTACPNAANCANLSGGPSLYDMQQRLCSLLTTSAPITDPAADRSSGSGQVGVSGLGIDRVGKRQLDNALAGCQQGGLSVAAAEEIFARRYSSPKHASLLAGDTGGDAKSHIDIIQNKGPAAVTAYETEHELEINNFYNKLNLDVQHNIQANLEKQNQQLAMQNKELTQQTELLVKQTQLLTQLLSHERPVVAGR